MIKTEMIEALFVAGEWTNAAHSEAIFDVTNPANGQTLATLPDAGREEMQRAIDAAAAAQEEWGATPAHEAREDHAPRRRPYARKKSTSPR
jgi:succinate-semialdehyde dehydrogenase/glutarate-semialdehyde dehydrogenase